MNLTKSYWANIYINLYLHTLPGGGGMIQATLFPTYWDTINNQLINQSIYETQMIMILCMF